MTNTDSYCHAMLRQYRSTHPIDETLNVWDIHDKSILLSQQEQVQGFCFSRRYTFLVLTDRLKGWVQGFQALLEKIPNCTAYFTFTVDEVYYLLDFMQVKPDFFLLIGYQKDGRNYEAIDSLRLACGSCVTAMFAVLDDCAKYDIAKYQITLAYDRYQPIVNSLKQLDSEYEAACLAEQRQADRIRRAREQAILPPPAKKRHILRAIKSHLCG